MSARAAAVAFARAQRCLAVRAQRTRPLLPTWRPCGQLAVRDDDNEQSPWMGIKFANASPLRADESDGSDGVETEASTGSPSVIEFADADVVVSEALKVARGQEHLHSWNDIVSRLRDLELDAVQSVLVLDCMVRLGIRNTALLSQVVDVIETRYFSMELGLRDLPEDLANALAVFPHRSGDFQSLLSGLPLRHKVKIILMDQFTRESGRLPERRRQGPPDAEKKWKVLEPIDMESWERRQFEQGRIRVKRVRNIRARVTKTPPGKRLAATLAVQLLQSLPDSNLSDFAEIAQAFAFTQRRWLHGDLRDDFQDELAKQVNAFDTHEVMPYALSFVAGFRTFAGAEAWRTWRRKLVPALMKLFRSPHVLDMLDGQRGFHPWTCCVGPRRGGPFSSSDEDADLQKLRVRADRISRLFTCLASARQAPFDTGLYDAISKPFTELLLRWRDLSSASVAGNHVPPLLPFELLSDVLAACAASGVTPSSTERGNSLPALMADLFVVEYGADIQDDRFERSKYAVADVGNAAHSIAVLLESFAGSGEVQDAGPVALDLLWKAAAPSLKTAQPHFVLMILNAVVRGGSEELLTSQPFLDAVDEHLSQKLDYDPSTLGKLVA